MTCSSDPISGQIKRAQLERVPWMLVLGKKEVENNTVTLRYLDGKQEFGLTIEDVLEKAKGRKSLGLSIESDSISFNGYPVNQA